MCVFCAVGLFLLFVYFLSSFCLALLVLLMQRSGDEGPNKILTKNSSRIV
uniref:Uncharacterized protein n=1 Tax=Anguilla anguilla TaxID=7936 RepID=A0A0E9QN61_ANGAN